MPLVTDNFKGGFIKEQRIRVNEFIRAREVRVVDEEGGMLGIMDPRKAQEIAEERGLDLVEVAPTASPPVCRIMNFGKYQYQQSKKAADARKHQKSIHVKEIKFRPRTDEHDYQFKKNNIIRFLEDGNKAKATVIFRGRENAHTDIGRRMLDRLVGDLQQFAEVEREPKLEGNQFIVIFAPKSRGASASSSKSIR
ncbi:MAG TPA: translation initiation factor IF-3 [Acidobacteriota bacterium]